MKPTPQSAKRLAFWSCPANPWNMLGFERTKKNPLKFLGIPNYFTLNILHYFYELKPQVLTILQN